MLWFDDFMGSDRARLPFFEMPEPVVESIQQRIDGKVVSAENALGGFTPGPAAVCVLSDGRRVFVKACSAELNSFAKAMHRREAEVLAALPANFPAPTLLATVEAGDWFALITEFVDGTMPTAPIDSTTAGRVLDLVTLLAKHGEGCSIDIVAPVGSDDREKDNRTSWRRLAESNDPINLDPWTRRNLKRLEALEGQWEDAASGSSLLHRDLRADNMLLTGPLAEAGGVAVDWPGASVGAPWIDLVGLLPALSLIGGPDPAAVFETHPIGAAAEPAAVNCYLSALTGYFISQSKLPPPPTASDVRAFQANQGRICQTWLSQRMGWEPLDSASC